MEMLSSIISINGHSIHILRDKQLQIEALVSLPTIAHLCPKAIHSILSTRIIALQHIGHCSNGFLIRVEFDLIQLMQRINSILLFIRRAEIDHDALRNYPSSSEKF